MNGQLEQLVTLLEHTQVDYTVLWLTAYHILENGCSSKQVFCDNWDRIASEEAMVMLLGIHQILL